MSNGTISNNMAHIGGGVYAENLQKHQMTGGSITNNTASIGDNNISTGSLY